MMESHGVPYLQEIVLILVAAGVLVPLFNRLRLSPVLGYLAAGFLFGPYGLGALADSKNSWWHYLAIVNPDEVAPLAEFGIVFLMFTIGLELSWRRLWAMRRLVFGLGAAQVTLCGAAIAGAFVLLGQSPSAAVILGACLALSSTAIVIQILQDRHLIATPMGRTCFSILLFQDLAVVPILILVGVLNPDSSESVSLAITLAFTKALAAIVALLVVGRFVLRPLFRLAGHARGEEPFVAVTLLTVIIAATITGMSGLSMALGAFLGGVLMAETEYSHAVEVYIQPFKGLLLGLFFMTIGMGIDPGVVMPDLSLLFVSVIALITVKAGITALAARAFGLRPGTALETGLLLGQSGEFAFVIIGAAVATKIVPASTGQFMLLVTGLSMVATPFVAMGGRHLGAWLNRWSGRKEADAVTAMPSMDLQGHVIIAGFGRVGRGIARILQDENVPYIALELDAETVAKQRAQGYSVVYADAARADMLKAFHPDNARAIVVTMSDDGAAEKAVQAARQFWPNVSVFARARDIAAAKRLHQSGATEVVAETVEAGLQLAGALLQGIGTSGYLVTKRLTLAREHIFHRIQGD